MSKRLAAAGAVTAALTAIALITSAIISPTMAEPAKSTDECLKGTIELAKEAEGKKLPDDKLAKIEDLLTKMEGHCEAKQFAEAAAVTNDVKAAIAGP